MNRCIFCLRPWSDAVQRSREHIFPAAVGGGPLHFDDVCTACNNSLGSRVDDGLVNNFLMDLTRHRYQLRGNSGTVPNPFGIGELDGRPGVEVLFEPGTAGRPNRLTVQPRVIKSAETDGTERSRITAAPENIEEIVAQIGKRARKRGLVPLAAAAPKVVKHVDPPLVYSKSFDLFGYIPGLLKIAYELTSLMMGEPYLDDPVANVIREFLMTYTADSDLVWPDFGARHGFGGLENDFGFGLSDDTLGALMIPSPEVDGIIASVSVLGTFHGTFRMSRQIFGLSPVDALVIRIDPVRQTFLRQTWREWFQPKPD